MRKWRIKFSEEHNVFTVESYSGFYGVWERDSDWKTREDAEKRIKILNDITQLQEEKTKKPDDGCLFSNASYRDVCAIGAMAALNINPACDGWTDEKIAVRAFGLANTMVAEKQRREGGK